MPAKTSTGYNPLGISNNRTPKVALPLNCKRKEVVAPGLSETVLAMARGCWGAWMMRLLDALSRRTLLDNPVISNANSPATVV
jgi:hypothetical protein